MATFQYGFTAFQPFPFAQSSRHLRCVGRCIWWLNYWFVTAVCLSGILWGRRMEGGRVEQNACLGLPAGSCYPTYMKYILYLADRAALLTQTQTRFSIPSCVRWWEGIAKARHSATATAKGLKQQPCNDDDGCCFIIIAAAMMMACMRTVQGRPTLH